MNVMEKKLCFYLCFASNESIGGFQLKKSLACAKIIWPILEHKMNGDLTAGTEEFFKNLYNKNAI